MRRLFAAVAVAMLVPGASLAQAEKAPVAADAAAKPVKPKKICKKVGEEEIGSRFGSEQVCKTAAQWDKLEQRKRR